MITINEDLLDTLGIQLTDEEKPAFMNHIREEIETRVGLAITDLLDDDEVAELIALQDEGDDTKVAAWIEATLPDVKNIIQDEFDLLMGEITAHV
jgi:hypothetical protein